MDSSSVWFTHKHILETSQTNRHIHNNGNQFRCTKQRHLERFHAPGFPHKVLILVLWEDVKIILFCNLNVIVPGYYGGLTSSVCCILILLTHNPHLNCVTVPFLSSDFTSSLSGKLDEEHFWDVVHQTICSMNMQYVIILIRTQIAKERVVLWVHFTKKWDVFRHITVVLL